MANAISEFPIPLVFRAVLIKKNSGILEITEAGGTKSLYLSQGKLESAGSNLKQERLAKILDLKGILSEEKLQVLLRDNKLDTDEKIGQHLVQIGMMTEKELYDCLRGQTLMIAANAFASGTGEWDFRHGAVQVIPGRSYHISMERIICTGIKEIIDFSFYRNLLQNCILKVEPLPPYLQKILSPFSMQFYSQMPAFNGHKPQKIGQQLSLPDELFWREFLLFYLLNVFEFEEGGDSTGSHAEIVFEFEPLVETVPLEPPPAAAEPQTPTETDAEGIYRCALQLYREKNFNQAASLLVPVVDLESSPPPHLFLLGLCFAQLPDFKEEAERYLQTVTRRESWNADPHYALGELYLAGGRTKQAADSFRRALEINHDHTAAESMLQEIEKREKE